VGGSKRRHIPEDTNLHSKISSRFSPLTFPKVYDGVIYPHTGEINLCSALKCSLLTQSWYVNVRVCMQAYINRLTR
jgi:hypothetical protein